MIMRADGPRLVSQIFDDRGWGGEGWDPEPPKIDDIISEQKDFKTELELL